MVKKTLISTCDMTYRVAGKTILSNVTMDIEAGKIHAIVGPNGSGKSTLLQLMAGIIASTEGDITLSGKAIKEWPKKTLAKALTFLPQSSPRPLGLTVFDLVACGRFPHQRLFGSLNAQDKTIINAAMDRTQVDHLASTVVDRLSGGEMQRVWLAMVLAQETNMLLLDEPTSYLDVSHQLRLLNIVKRLNQEKGMTVIWVLHDLNQAVQYSDQIAVIHNGQLVIDKPAHHALPPKVLNDVFGIEATLINAPKLSTPIIVPVSEATMAESV